LLATVLASGAWLLTHMTDTTTGVKMSITAAIAVGSVLFVVRELRHSDPVLQPRFFKRRTFAAATGGIALSNLSLYVLLLAVPLLLSRRPGWSEASIGFMLTSMSIGMVVLAPLGGRIGDRFGRRLPAGVGLSVLAAAVSVLAVVGPGVSGPVLIATLLCSGAGLGLSSASLQTSAVEAIEARHAGMAAGTNSTARYLGSIVGTSVLAGSLAAGDGFQTVLTLTAVTAAGSAVLSLLLPAHRPQPADYVAEPGVLRNVGP
jgi:MFS family permease